MTETTVMPVDAVLFDLGGVLIDWNPRHLYRQYFDDVATMEDFLERVCAPSWNHEIDAGRSVDEAVAERQALFPEHAWLIALWRDGWPRMLGGAIEETVALLRALRERAVPLYALTNWSAETFPIARERFGFLDWFAHIVVSGEVGLAKPDPAIFALASRHTCAAPERTLFIDDSPVNVAAARSLGFQVHRFTSTDALERDIVARGLL